MKKTAKPRRPMKGERYVHIGDQPWGYRIGHGNTVIVAPDGKKTIVDHSTMTGRSPSVIERGQWKKTSDGMVTPEDVWAYINRHLAVHPTCKQCGMAHLADGPCPRPPPGEPLAEEAAKALRTMRAR